MRTYCFHCNRNTIHKFVDSRVTICLLCGHKFYPEELIALEEGIELDFVLDSQFNLNTNHKS